MSASQKKENIQKIIIVGSGETAELAYEYFKKDSPYEVVAFAVDEEYKKADIFLEKPLCLLEEIKEKFPPTEYLVFVAISSGHLNRDRANMFFRLKDMGYKFASYISSKAFVWDSVKIGENCFVLENNVLQHGVIIGDNVTLWSGNHIGHRTQIKDHVFVTSHVVIAGYCSVGEYSFLGVNTAISDGITLEKDVFLGAGIVVNRNLPENTLYQVGVIEASNVTPKRLFRVK